MSDNFVSLFNNLVELGAEHIVLLSVASLSLFFLSLFLLLKTLLNLPKDYWLYHQNFDSQHSGNILFIFRNLMALILFLTGVAMLFLPGQGLLTILVALLLSDLPFKKYLIKSIIKKPGVQRALNSLRTRFNKEKFLF